MLLQFHYEDVLRQDLLLKLNYVNVLSVPGVSSIILVPKAASPLIRKSSRFGKLAMEISCGQRFIEGPSLEAGIRSWFEKERGARQSGRARLSKKGSGISHFLIRISTVISIFSSSVEIRENAILFSMEREFCEFSPELDDHFEIFEHLRGFHVTILTSAKTKDETLVLWSGFLLKDEGERDVGEAK